MIENYFVIEFTYYEKDKLRTTYAGPLCALSTPFSSYDKAKKFESVDEAKAWLNDILKNVDFYTDYAFSRKKLKSVKFICVHAFPVEDITDQYISNLNN